MIRGDRGWYAWDKVRANLESTERVSPIPLTPWAVEEVMVKGALAFALEALVRDPRIPPLPNDKVEGQAENPPIIG